MKKLLFILPVLFTLAINAQQTEDEVYIGKGKTFGKYNGRGIIIPETDRNAKPVDGQTTVTGMVVGTCKPNCNSLTVKKSDGTIVTVGTRDNGFTVPKGIVGRNIIIEGLDLVGMGGRKRKTVKNDYQKDIQFAATGIKVIE